MSDTVSKLRDVISIKANISKEEWQARVDLAAAYRLVRANGWNVNIYNHCSHRVPGEPDYFLIKAHPLLWDEVTASNLVKVDMREELDERANVNRPGFVLHSAILRARKDVNAVVHIHEESTIAVSSMKEGLLPLTQDAIFLYEMVGYHAYNGITEDAEERQQIVNNLSHHSALIMRNHGTVSVGETMRDAYVTTGHLVKASQIQLQLMSSGAELEIPSAEICRRAADQYIAHGKGRGQADWPAYLRELDRLDPSYRR